MAVSVSRGDGVTVLTVSTDSSSVWPPLCQILGGLCCNPSCCSPSPPLRSVQRSSQSLLGALHTMSGLLCLGLSVILSEAGSRFYWFSYFPFWFSALFILLGVVAILSQRFPSPCLVLLNVLLQLIGVAFAIAAIVLYAINVADIGYWGLCEDYYYDNPYDVPYRRDRPTPSAEEKTLKEACLDAKRLTLALLISINAVLIVLSVLELCLTISSSVLGIQSLRSIGRNRDQGSEDPETYKPLVA